MPSPAVKQLLSMPAGMSLGVTGRGQNVFRKDAVRAGRYFVPHAGAWADIPVERLDHWAQQFQTMAQAGVKTYFTVDHKPGVEARRGEVVNLFRDGDRLMFDVRIEPDDTESKALILRNPEVSIEVDPVFTDSRGAKYQDVITAISAVRHPVVTDQQPFIALSVDGGSQTTNAMVLVLSDHGRTQETPMFNADQIKQLRTLIGAKDDIKDDALAPMVLEKLTSLGKDATAGTEAQKLVASLQGQVAELQKQVQSGKAPEIDSDLLEQQAELIGERLSLLVEKGNITAAVAEEAKALMLGQTGKRPALMLSHKAAVAAGLPQAMHKPILDLLGKLQMGVKAGQKTQAQVLHRDVPDGTDPDPATIKAMADLAYGKSK